MKSPGGRQDKCGYRARLTEGAGKDGVSLTLSLVRHRTLLLTHKSGCVCSAGESLPGGVLYNFLLGSQKRQSEELSVFLFTANLPSRPWGTVIPSQGHMGSVICSPGHRGTVNGSRARFLVLNCDGQFDS